MGSLLYGSLSGDYPVGSRLQLIVVVGCHSSLNANEEENQMKIDLLARKHSIHDYEVQYA